MSTTDHMVEWQRNAGDTPDKFSHFYFTMSETDAYTSSSIKTGTPLYTAATYDYEKFEVCIGSNVYDTDDTNPTSLSCGYFAGPTSPPTTANDYNGCNLGS
jgi:hypothetical protein